MQFPIVLPHTHCNTHCNTLIATLTLQHTHCSTHCNTHTHITCIYRSPYTYCNTLCYTHTLQHTHCATTHTLQHTHTHSLHLLLTCSNPCLHVYTCPHPSLKARQHLRTIRVVYSQYHGQYWVMISEKYTRYTVVC